MEFLTKLVERNPVDWEKMKELSFFQEDNRTRILQGVNFGNVHLSIQASHYHYCSPRTTTDLDSYNTMELAVIINEDGQSIWTNLEDSEIFKDFPKIEEFKERNDCNGLYGYLDVSLIEDLYQYLKIKAN